jgi:hypothetical protein
LAWVNNLTIHLYGSSVLYFEIRGSGCPYPKKHNTLKNKTKFSQFAIESQTLTLRQGCAMHQARVMRFSLP